MAVVLPNFRTDSLATYSPPNQICPITLASRRHHCIEETSMFWQVEKAEQTTGTSTDTTIALISKSMNIINVLV